MAIFIHQHERVISIFVIADNTKIQCKCFAYCTIWLQSASTILARNGALLWILASTLTSRASEPE